MHPLVATWKLIDNLKRFDNNWDGNHSKKPKPSAIEAAKIWAAKLYQELQEAGMEFNPPNVTAPADGIPVFEWWKDNRKLTVYAERGFADGVVCWAVAAPLYGFDECAMMTPRQRRWAWGFLEGANAPPF